MDDGSSGRKQGFLLLKVAIALLMAPKLIKFGSKSLKSPTKRYRLNFLEYRMGGTALIKPKKNLLFHLKSSLREELKKNQ